MKNKLYIDNDITNEKTNLFNSEKISFLSHFSHCVRTPLNAIMGFSNLLSSEQLPDPKHKEYISKILNGSNLLLQFVENITDLSLFETGNYTLNLNTYNLNQIINEYIIYFNSQKNENNINYKLNLVYHQDIFQVKIETDIDLLKKTIQRLINSVAFKYHNQTLELECKIIDRQWIYFLVRPAYKKFSSEQSSVNKNKIHSYLKDDSFDYFNYKALVHSVLKFKGKLNLNDNTQEYYFKIRRSFSKN